MTYKTLKTYSEYMQKNNDDIIFANKTLNDPSSSEEDKNSARDILVSSNKIKNQITSDYSAATTANKTLNENSNLSDIISQSNSVKFSNSNNTISASSTNSTSADTSNSTSIKTSTTTVAKSNSTGSDGSQTSNISKKSSIINKATALTNTQSSQATKVINTKMAPQTDRRIKLRPKSGINSFISDSIILKPLSITNGLIFPADVQIDIVHNANYGEQHTTHMNQDFRYYTGTPAQVFRITGTFTSQNTQESLYSLAAMHFISVLTKMHTGSNSSTDSSIGLPPPVMLLSGFGPYIFNDLPVIFLSGSYRYEPSVDIVSVILNNVENDVPSLFTISIEVAVQNTPQKLRTFNWEQFAQGSLLTQGGWK